MTNKMKLLNENKIDCGLDADKSVVFPTYLNNDNHFEDFSDFIEADKPAQNIPASRATQLKRLLATAGKGVVGNISLAVFMYAASAAWWMLPMAAVRGMPGRDVLVMSGFIIGIFTAMWHSLGIVAARHPFGGFLLGEDFFERMREKLPEKYKGAKDIGQDILDLMRTKMVRHNMKSK